MYCLIAWRRDFDFYPYCLEAITQRINEKKSQPVLETISVICDVEWYLSSFKILYLK